MSAFSDQRELKFMLDFARRWSAFGGPPPDEVFLLFGITRHAFDARLLELSRRRRAG